MDKGKSRKNGRFMNDDDEDEIDLTLRLSLTPKEKQNTEANKLTIKSHGFWNLRGDNSNDEVPHYRYSNMFAKQHGLLPTNTNNWGGSSTYESEAAGLLVAPLRPITVPTIRCYGSTLSSHDQGYLPLTGFATPSRMQPTTRDGRLCRSCGCRESPLWRKGPQGPQTLCNKCGLKHSRHLKRGSN